MKIVTKINIIKNHAIPLCQFRRSFFSYGVHPFYLWLSLIWMASCLSLQLQLEDWLVQCRCFLEYQACCCLELQVGCPLFGKSLGLEYFHLDVTQFSKQLLDHLYFLICNCGKILKSKCKNFIKRHLYSIPCYQKSYMVVLTSYYVELKLGFRWPVWQTGSRNGKKYLAFNSRKKITLTMVTLCYLICCFKTKWSALAKSNFSPKTNYE